MPKKLDRCIKEVRKSLKKYGRTGNPYAICKSSLKMDLYKKKKKGRKKRR